MSRTPRSVFDAIAAQRAQRKAAVMAEIAVTEQSEHDDDVGAEIAEREAVDEIIASRIHRGRW